MYIPSTDGERIIDAAEFAARRDQAADMFRRCSAGAGSRWPPAGTAARTGEIVSEKVTVLTGFGDADDLERKRREFLDWLIDKQDDWSQEALGFEFEGDLWYLWRGRIRPSHEPDAARRA